MIELRGLHLGNIARSPAESARPDLWPDHAWVPALGCTGGKLYDLAGLRSDADYVSGGWSTDGIQTNGTTNYARLGVLTGLGNLSAESGRAFAKLGLVIAVRFKMSTYAQACIFGQGSSFGDSSPHSLNLLVNVGDYNSQSNGNLIFSLRQGPTMFGLSVVFGPVLEVDKWHTFVCSVKLNAAPEDSSFWLDGSKQNPTVLRNDYSDFQAFSLNNFCLGCLGLKGGGQDGYFPGEIAYLTLRKGCGQANLVKELQLDPLLPFRRRQPVYYSVPSGGGSIETPAAMMMGL